MEPVGRFERGDERLITGFLILADLCPQGFDLGCEFLIVGLGRSYGRRVGTLLL